jgi:hypothetical protein
VAEMIVLGEIHIYNFVTLRMQEMTSRSGNVLTKSSKKRDKGWFSSLEVERWDFAP